jgi:hypothetical protein
LLRIWRTREEPPKIVYKAARIQERIIDKRYWLLRIGKCRI